MMRHDIEFDAEGVTLRGWFYEAADPRPFDLDHPHAEVGELAGGQWRGHRMLKGDNPSCRWTR